MATPHVAGVAALALAAHPASTPDMVAQFLVDNASLNKVGSAGTGSPNRLVFSLATGTPQAPVSVTTSVAAIQGSAALSGRKNWVAYAQVTVRDAQGNPVPNATVSGSFNPGGSTTCLTASTGQCKLASKALSKAKVAFTDFTVMGISGTSIEYDASQNSATRIRISRP
jgi:subtilisin family serine protease